MSSVAAHVDQDGEFVISKALRKKWQRVTTEFAMEVDTERTTKRVLSVVAVVTSTNDLGAGFAICDTERRHCARGWVSYQP